MAARDGEAAALDLLRGMAAEQGVALAAERLAVLAAPLAALRAGLARLDTLPVERRRADGACFRPGG